MNDPRFTLDDSGRQTYTAPAGGVQAGVPVLIGQVLVIPEGDADAGDLFSGLTRPVVGLDHSGGSTFTAGAPCYYDSTTGEIDDAPSADNTLVGFAAGVQAGGKVVVSLTGGVCAAPGEHPQIAVIPAAAGNLADLSVLGIIGDSGIAAADVQVLTVPAVADSLAGLDAAGALTDSGIEIADVQVLTVPAVADSLAGLDAAGALTDSGIEIADVQVLTPPAAADNLAGLSALGAITDSGIAAADVQVLTVPAAAGNLAGLDAAGTLTDSGVAAADVQVLTVPAVAGSIATLDAAGALDDSGIVVTAGAIDGADVTAGAASDVDTLHGEVLTALAPTLPAQHAVVTHAAAPAGVAVGCMASSGSVIMLTALAVYDLVPIWEGGAAAAGIYVHAFGAGQPAYVSPAGALYADLRGFGFGAGAVGYVLSASGRALPVTCAVDPTDGGANAAVHIEGVASAFEADLSGFPGAPANVDVPLSTTHRQSLALATITA